MMAVSLVRNESHIPVMLDEAVDALIVDPAGIYVDATFGRGSHSQAILDRLNEQGTLFSFDRDLVAIQYAQQQSRLSQDKRFHLYHKPFSALKATLSEEALIGNLNGILFDLGVSSPQLDDPARGFSFMQDGPLDMRMDTTQGETAAEWLARVDEKTLCDVLWQYGEERFAKRIARFLVASRGEQPIDSTQQLAERIKQAVPRAMWDTEKHPATRTFQAIRIVINRELDELTLALKQAYDCLAIGGRLVVISFHSLEDRIVKQFIQENEKGMVVPRDLPIKAVEFRPKLKALSKALKPSMQEVHRNRRARSAILRIAEKRS